MILGPVHSHTDQPDVISQGSAPSQQGQVPIDKRKIGSNNNSLIRSESSLPIIFVDCHLTSDYENIQRRLSTLAIMGSLVLRSARFAPLFIFRTISFVSPSFSLCFIPPFTKTLGLQTSPPLPPLKPYSLSHLPFFTLMTRSLDPVACILGCTHICTVRLIA